MFAVMETPSFSNVYQQPSAADLAYFEQLLPGRCLSKQDDLKDYSHDHTEDLVFYRDRDGLEELVRSRR